MVKLLKSTIQWVPLNVIPPEPVYITTLSWLFYNTRGEANDYTILTVYTNNNGEFTQLNGGKIEKAPGISPPRSASPYPPLTECHLLCAPSTCGSYTAPTSSDESWLVVRLANLSKVRSSQNTVFIPRPGSLSQYIVSN